MTTITAPSAAQTIDRDKVEKKLEAAKRLLILLDELGLEVEVAYDHYGKEVTLTAGKAVEKAEDALSQQKGRLGFAQFLAGKIFKSAEGPVKSILKTKVANLITAVIDWHIELNQGHDQEKGQKLAQLAYDLGIALEQYPNFVFEAVENHSRGLLELINTYKYLDRVINRIVTIREAEATTAAAPLERKSPGQRRKAQKHRAAKAKRAGVRNNDDNENPKGKQKQNQKKH